MPVSDSGGALCQCRTLEVLYASVGLSITILQGTLKVSDVTPWSAGEMLDGQRQRVDVPAYVGTARHGLSQKRLEEDLC